MSMKLTILFCLLCFIVSFTAVNSYKQCRRIVRPCLGVFGNRRCNGCCKEGHCLRGTCYRGNCMCQSCNAQQNALSARYRNACKYRIGYCKRSKWYRCRQCCRRSRCHEGQCVWSSCVCSRCPA